MSSTKKTKKNNNLKPVKPILYWNHAFHLYLMRFRTPRGFPNLHYSTHVFFTH